MLANNSRDIIFSMKNNTQNLNITNKSSNYNSMSYTKYYAILVLFLGVIVTGSIVLSDNKAIAQSSSTMSFTRNLKIGDQGPDVKLLQQILNIDPVTAVAVSGIGAVGKETATFGAMTQRAVIRFQKKYAAMTLTPIGLVEGTGYVGSLTRSALASVFNTKSGASKNTSNNTNSTNQTNTGGVNYTPNQTSSSDPVIYSLDPSSGTNDTTVTIHGANFDLKNNTVLLAYEPSTTFTNIPSADGKTLSFKMKSSILVQIATKLQGKSPSAVQKVQNHFPAYLALGVIVRIPDESISNIANFNLKLK